jgi:hypothetical protein
VNAPRSLARRLTSPSRLWLMGGIFGVFILAAFVVQHATARRLVDDQEVILGRDFVAFYTAGRVVRDGHGRQIYDYATQASAQAAVIAPETREGTAYFTNPAFVAVPYAIAARLPYLGAFYLHTLLMALLVVAGVYVLRRHLHELGHHWRLAALLGLVWLPMLNSVAGGQNSALTFLLLAVAYTATVERQQVVAGLAVGLLFFKPQFALPLLGLLLLKRQYVTALVAMAAGGVEYLVGSLCCGWDWPVQMLNAIRFFRVEERLANGPRLISLVEAVDYALGLPALGWSLMLVLTVWLAWTWRKAAIGDDDFPLYWALATAVILLISPHSQHYDVAILLLPILLILAWMSARRRPMTDAVRVALLAGFFAYPLFLTAPALRFQPLVLAPILVSAWAVWLLRTAGSLTPPPASFPPPPASRSAPAV